MALDLRLLAGVGLVVLPPSLAGLGVGVLRIRRGLVRPPGVALDLLRLAAVGSSFSRRASAVCGSAFSASGPGSFARIL